MQAVLPKALVHGIRFLDVLETIRRRRWAKCFAPFVKWCFLSAIDRIAIATFVKQYRRCNNPWSYREPNIIRFVTTLPTSFFCDSCHARVNPEVLPMAFSTSLKQFVEEHVLSFLLPLSNDVLFQQTAFMKHYHRCNNPGQPARPQKPMKHRWTAHRLS